MPSKYKLYVARPTGWRLECPDIATLMWTFAVDVYLQPDLVGDMGNHRSNRVNEMRNHSVKVAREEGCTHWLTIDPDMVVDRYVRYDEHHKPVGRFRPFFPTFWEFMLKHPGSILAAPYCGAYPDRPIHVFGTRSDTGKMGRFNHGAVEQNRGWTEVDQVGCGLMMADMRVFDAIDRAGEGPPYFEDVYRDKYHIDSVRSSDANFCYKATKAGGKVYVNWDCWCGHWQNSIVDPPGLEGAATREYGGPTDGRPLPSGRNGETGADLPEGHLRGPAEDAGVVPAT